MSRGEWCEVATRCAPPVSTAVPLCPWPPGAAHVLHRPCFHSVPTSLGPLLQPWRQRLTAVSARSINSIRHPAT